MRQALSIFALAVATVFAATAFAAPLGTIVLEGQLRTVAGSAVPDGDYSLKVSLYKDKQDPKALHSETINTKVKGGGFLLSLGLAQALKSDVFAGGSAAWVGIQVGTESELPRLPLNHVAYAFAASHAAKAADVACTGCIKTDHLAKDVLKDYAKSADLKAYVAVDQACKAGEHATGFGKDGKIQCAKDANNTYSGKQFTLSSQSCPAGKVVAGIDADGKVKCDLGGKTYNGKNFAVSNQKCPAGEVVVAINSEGKAVCKPDQKGQASGKDFALSGKGCGKGKVQTGVDAAGNPTCTTIAYEKPIPAGALSQSAVVNLAKGQLANGKTPWNDKKAYDISGAWLKPTSATKPFLAHGNKRQMVFRTDGDAEYNKGVGSYPFVFMFGGDVSSNRTAAIHQDGGVWTKKYGWLHKRFAAANKGCKTGFVMSGTDADGNPKCVLDKNSTLSPGTYMRSETGSKMGADLAKFDKRYVNEGQANSVSSAMITDGQVGNKDLANGSVSAAKIGAGQVTGSHVANSSLTGSDIKNSSLTGSDIANGTIGRDDIANGSINGPKIAGNVITSGHVLNGSLTGDDIKNESLTGSDIKNGSLTYSDTNVNSIQRRIDKSCPTGQAIRAINNNGTVVCAAEVGADAATYKANVKKNRWYRLATCTKNQRCGGTFIVGDSAGNSLIFRVGISRGIETGMAVKLLHHSGDGTRLFTTLRVAEGGTGHHAYVDVRANYDASAWYSIRANNAVHKFGANKLQDIGTAGSVGGYSNRTYGLDNLAMVGNWQEAMTVDRLGRMMVRSNTGYIQLGSYNTSHAHIQTDRGSFYMNRELKVDSGVIGSYNEDLYLRRAGSNGIQIRSGDVLLHKHIHANNKQINYVDQLHFNSGFRMYDDGNKGILNVRSGNTSTVEMRMMDSAGNTHGYVYGDSNTTVGFLDASHRWAVRVENNNYVRMFTKGGERLRADNSGAVTYGRHHVTGNLYAKSLTTDSMTNNGNLHVKGTLTVDKPATLKSTASVGSTLSVGGTANLNNGVSVDGKTVIDNGAGWHRSYGQTGHYNGTYGGGIWMKDTSWVRVYGSKNFLVENALLQVSDGNGSVQINRGTHPAIEMRSNKNGSPYIDFSNSSSGDYDARLQISGDNDLNVYGANFHVRNGWIYGQAGAGLRFYDNSYGGSGDAAYIHYYSEGGENTKLRILNNNDADDDIELYQNGAARLTVRSGRVGINNTNPSYTMDVNGSLRASSMVVYGKSLSDYIKDVVNDRCYVYFGWRDSANGATGYSKIVRVRGSSSNNCNSSGTNGNCWNTTAWSPITLGGLNTDGDVNGDDKFWIGFRCY